MIAVIDTMLSGISHEAFNAGMLYQLSNVYPDEEIVYFCEKEQGKFVRRILDIHDCKHNIRFSYINNTYLSFDRQSIEGSKKEYVEILRQCSNVKLVLVLTVEAVNSGLLKNLMKKLQNIKFGICIHGYIEDILPQNTVKFSLNSGVFNAVKEYRQKEGALRYFKQNLADMAKMYNCNIILFSDMYKRYKDCIDPQVYQNIKVLNLPYIFTYNKEALEVKQKFRIGIMPSSVAAKDMNCIKIIKYMIKHKDMINHPYSFVIFNYDIGNLENVEYVRRPRGTRKDIEHFMKLCDWMLIPYDENKYILSSSGVMFDAIESERPFFVLGSPSFYKAIEAGCGIQEKSIEKLAGRIIDQINKGNPGYGEFRENIRNYKKRMEMENLERLTEIFGK